MRAWLIRGCVLAVSHAGAQVLLAELAVVSHAVLGWARPVALGLLIAIAFAGGMLDAHRRDPGVLWLKASLVAGWLAALLGVLGKALLVDETGVSALGGALTGGAAFTALLVLVPASLGMLASRLVRRIRYGKPPEPDDEDEDPDPQLESPSRPRRGGLTSRPAQRGRSARPSPR